MADWTKVGFGANVAGWTKVVSGANVADWKTVGFGAKTEGVKAAAAANTQGPTSKSAVADVGKTAVACAMIVRWIRAKIVGIGHSGDEQSTVHCMAQRSVVALSNYFDGVGVRAVVGGQAVGNVVPQTEGMTGLESENHHVHDRNPRMVEQV